MKKINKVKYKIELKFESDYVIGRTAMRVMCENLAVYLATNKHVNNTEIHTDWFIIFRLLSKDNVELCADAKSKAKIMKIAKTFGYTLPENRVTIKSKNGGKNVK
jgi:hypothetical protein